MNYYTVEVYKSDKRTKIGERLLQTKALILSSPKSAVAQHWSAMYPAPAYRTEVHQTFLWCWPKSSEGHLV